MAKKKVKRRVKKNVRNTGALILLILLIGLFLFIVYNYFLYKQELKPVNNKKDYYTISDFGYTRLKSKNDYNNNGKDDYTDILEGEKKYAKFNPAYKSNYYEGGYPPVKKEGVCTDVIWYALKNAGYNLKNMIDKDVKNTWGKGFYSGIGYQDTNIDFRRVGNQESFFKRYAKVLDVNVYDIGSFMPGDIIVFDDGDHIAMVSDKYNKNGVPYLIQNRDESQTEKEEDRLEETDMEVTGHYRFEYNEKLENLIKS